MGTITTLLVRIIFPAILLTGIILRPYGLSLIYLLLYLSATFASVPDKKSFTGWPGKLLLLAVVLSCLIVLLQIAWYVACLILETRDMLEDENDRYSETYPRFIIDFMSINTGLVIHRMNYERELQEIIDYVLPDIIVAIGMLFTFFLVRYCCHNSGTNDEKPSYKYLNHNIFEKSGKCLVMFLVMASGVVDPSVTSGVYYLTFLGSALAWALGRTQGRHFINVCRCLMGLMALHITILLVYQSPVIKSFYTSDYICARYFGLRDLLNYRNCGFFAIGSKVHCFDRLARIYDWKALYHPSIVLITYSLLGLVSQNTAREGVNRVLQEQETKFGLKMRGDIKPIRRLSRRLPFSGEVRNSAAKQDLLQAAAEIFNKGIRYVTHHVTVIAMIYWSLEYHSWAGLVLLVWAIIALLCRDSGAFVARSSPVLVGYTMLMLIAQYIYALNANKDELPHSFFNQTVSVKDFGIDQDNTTVTLLIKSILTCFVCIDLRQSWKKRRNNQRYNEQFELHEHQAVIVRKVTKRLHSFFARVWIYVVAGMMFALPFIDDQITVMNVVYMIFFFVFILIYQINKDLWRRFMYPFWITVIVYSVIYSITIYVYKFHSFFGVFSEGYDAGNLKIIKKPWWLLRKLTLPLVLIVSTIRQVYRDQTEFVHWMKSKTTKIKFSKNSIQHENDISPESDVNAEKKPRDLSRDNTGSVEDYFNVKYNISKEEPTNNDISMEEITTEEEFTITSQTASVMIESNIVDQKKAFVLLEREMDFKRETKASVWQQKLQAFIDFVWFLLSLHFTEIIFLAIIYTCLYEITIFNLSLMMIVLVGLSLDTTRQRYCILITSLLMSMATVEIMISHSEVIISRRPALYAIKKTPNSIILVPRSPGTPKYEHRGVINCSPVSVKIFCDNYVFFEESINIETDEDSPSPTYSTSLILYIVLISLFTAYAVVNNRQSGIKSAPAHGITRAHADKDIIHCVQYLLIYGFYKFGVEMTLTCLAFVIAHRMDVNTIFYIAWLVILSSVKRRVQARLWRTFTISVAILIVVQYLILLQFMSHDQNWILTIYLPKFLNGTDINTAMRLNWFFVPDDNLIHIDGSRLFYDCVLVTFAAIQLGMFKGERLLGTSHPGGSNDLPTSEEWEHPGFFNPVKDFLSINGTMLDKLKSALFVSFPCISIAMVVIAAVGDVSIFSIGYLIGSFIFIWHGTEILLHPKNTLLLWWSRLLNYTLFVLIVKVFMRIPACVFSQYVEDIRFKGLSHLLGMNCMDTYVILKDERKARMVSDYVFPLLDAICFSFLLLQRRMFHSYYYHRIVDDVKATAAVSHRGIELYQQILKRKLERQKIYEMSVHERIKIKMDKIKRNQKYLEEVVNRSAHNGYDEMSHQKAIRSGDFYMFADIEDEIINYDEKDSSDDEDFVNVYFSESMPNLTDELQGDAAAVSGAPRGTATFKNKAKIQLFRLNIILSEFLLMLSKHLFRISKHYRKVSCALLLEKMNLKEKEDFKIGIRGGSCRIWKPLSKSLQSTNSVDATEPRLRNSLEKYTSPFHQFAYALFYSVMTNTDKIFYIAAFFNQINTASILSLPLPLMIFFWGTLTKPRASKKFWITVLIYTMLLISIKTLFQSKAVPWEKLEESADDPFIIHRIIGIETTKNFAFWDLLSLLALVIHRNNLQNQGLWVDSNESEENNTDVLPTTTNARTDDSEDVETSNTDDKSFSVDGDEQEIVVTSKKSYDRPRHQNTHSIDEVAIDLYAFMFLCDFINIFIVMFNYPAFGRYQDSLQDYIRENKVPTTFLVMLILQFTLILADRAIYLWKYLRGKIYLQFGLIIGVHVWMFFVLPFFTEQSFNSLLPPTLWYLFKCTYLLLAARQIKGGYPSSTFGNAVCKSYNIINMILFRVYMAVPLLFEVRTIMDWVWTSTSMSLMDWIKMEDIYAHVFLLKCSRVLEDKFPQQRAQEKSKLSKSFLGGALLIIVISIVWFPLLFFAYGNKIGKPNLPDSVTLQVDISNFLPIVQVSAIRRDIHELTQAEYEQIHQKSSRELKTLLGNYKNVDIASVKFETSSRVKWDLTDFEKIRFKKELMSNKTLPIRVRYEISRLNDKNEYETPALEVFTVSHIDPSHHRAEKEMLINMWTGRATSLNCWFNVDDILPRYLKVTNKGQPTLINNLVVSREKSKTFTTISNSRIKLRLEGNATHGYVWRMRLETYDNFNQGPFSFLFANQDDIDDDENTQIKVLTFNDRIIPKTYDFLFVTGIVGLYTTFVFVISKMVRSFYYGENRNIMFKEIPNVDRILQLCHDIYLVREAKEWELEESLFAKLLFLYRSPETMIKWSRHEYLREIPKYRRKSDSELAGATGSTEVKAQTSTSD